jgi:class 3 adenylate cyclase/tetratricopeptide (TPR) repeat protein
VTAEGALERRIVTVLFADLVGFTTLSEAYDAEDVAAIQDRYFGAVRETIGRYGGRLEKFIGDAAMAVFGVPRARDDDAERAVRAGLALIHAIDQIGASLGLEEDALRLRVGINTGEAVAASGGPDEGRVTGDTVNTAARLQTAAPPGGVLIGEPTALAVADVAQTEVVPPLELKGKAEPFAARLVTGLRAQPSREVAMGALQAPTLGRDAELQALTAARARADQGAGVRVTVIAPPGVGKSRLLREFADRATAAPEALIWRSRARPDSVSPFDPVARLLLDALQTVERKPAARQLNAALSAAGASADRAQVVAEACLSVVFPLTAVDDASGKPSEERDSLFAAWLEALDAIAAGRPQTWLVEDVHWAGGDVLAFLDRAAHGRRRLVIATARPSLLEAAADWATDDPPGGLQVLQLSALESGDAAALVRALVGDALPDELVERIAQRSDGNPLFIEELLRTWVSVGTLVPAAAGGWQLTVPVDEVALPQSVQQIYAAQLDDLPADARRLARRASVAGRRFPVGALEPLDAGSGIEPLQRRQLVVGPVTEPIWGEAFAYRHALLRDAGYASLARAERARLHVRLARWLEQAAGDYSAEVAEQIAGHYAAALESAPALAREVDEGLDRDAVRSLAARWYERAGQSALSLSAHDAARQLFRLSLDLTPDEIPADKARRWERLGDATAFAADMDEGAAAYRKAMELYRTAIDALRMAGGVAAEALAPARAGLARTTAALADVMYQQLQFADAAQLAQTVMAEIGEGDPASEARLLIARARGSLGAAGTSPEIERDFERAVELAGALDDPQLRVNASSGLALVRSESGRGDQALWHDVADKALAAGEWKEAIGASTNAIMYLLDDRAPETFPLIDDARATALAHGFSEELGWLDYLAAEAAFISGDWPRARELGGRAIALGEANAYLRMTVRTWHIMIPIAGVIGDRATLEHAARWYQSLEGKFEFPDSPYSRVIRTAQDLELAAHGLWPEFVPEVEPRIASFDDDPSGPSWSAALDRVFRSWMEAGEIAGAQRALAALEGALARMPGVTNLGHGTGELLRGRLALARGDMHAAATAGRAALERFRVSDAPWWKAKALRLIERARAADGQMLDEVAAIERALGAVAPTA